MAKTSQKIHLQAFLGETQKKLPQMHDPKKNPIFSWFLGTFEEADLDNSGTMEVPPAFFSGRNGVGGWGRYTYLYPFYIDTIDGRNPAPPGMYKTLWILWYRSYIHWCRISAINSMTYIPKQTGWMVQRPLMTAVAKGWSKGWPVWKGSSLRKWEFSREKPGLRDDDADGDHDLGPA